MFKLDIDKNIIEHAVYLVERTNYGKRGEADGNKRQQVRGLIGQCVVMDVLGHDLPALSDKHDGGIDMNYNGLTIDIKTMGRNCDPKPDYVNNLIGLQSHFNVDAYIFCSLNRKDVTLTICGWILKKEFLKRALFTPKNGSRQRADGSNFETKADLYELKNNCLNHVKSIEELKMQLKQARHLL